MARPLNTVLACVSLSRVLAGFAILLMLRGGEQFSALISIGLITIAQATDHLDGFIARKYSYPSVLGYFQDSLADKIFQFSVIVAICREYEIPSAILVIVFSREVCILAIRSFKNFSHSKLSSMKKHSIAYNGALRIGIVIAILIPILPGEFAENFLFAASWIMVLATIPALSGIAVALKN